VRRVDTSALVVNRPLIPGSTSGGAFNVRDFIPQSSPGIPAELDFNVTLRAVNGGRNSQSLQTVNFEVFGFGLDFGSDFGGQDTGGANLGVVLNQSAPPFAPEPVPGVNTLRTQTYAFSGTPTTTETLTVFFTFYGGPDGLYNTNFNITGSTPEALAFDLVDELETRLPVAVRDNLDIQRVGASVTVSSYFGGFQGSVVNSVGQAVTNLEQAPRGSVTGRQQQAFIDFWRTEFNAQIGAGTDVLAPENAASYTSSTSLQLIVRGLTHAARLALAVVPGGPLVRERQFGFVFQSPLPSPTRLNVLDVLAQALNTVGDFRNYVSSGLGQNTASPTNDNGNNIAMARTGVTLLVNEGYSIDVYGPTGASQVSNSGTGFACLPKQVTGPIFGPSLSQVISVSVFRPFAGGVNFAAGQQFILNLDGTEIIYTATAPDVTLEGAASRYRDPVLEYWLANLPGGYTGRLAQWPNRETGPRSDGRAFFYSELYITRTSTNTPFTYNVSAGNGIRAVVTRT